MIDYDAVESGVIRDDPFPWMVVDGFLKEGYCERLREGFPGGKSSGKGRTNVQGKVWTASSDRMTQVQREFFDEVCSDKFLFFLQEVTGIDKVYADRLLMGGGLHESHNEGFLKVHTDFNQLKSTGKHRALNMMLYLNEGWQEDWGGCLELWPADLKKKAHTIIPVMNRMVLFRTSEVSFHGHPEPIKAPKGVTRKSLAVYYYEDWPKGLKPRPNTHYVETPR